MSSRVNQKQAARVVREQLAKEKARTRRIYVSIGVIVVLIFAGIGGWAVYNSQRADTANAAVPANTNSARDGLVVGSGPATIDVYLDFMCPICGEFEKSSGDAINKLVDAGKAKIVYHPVAFLDRFSQNTEYSTRSSAAAGCASDAGKTREYVTAMFANQPAERSKGLTNDEIVQKSGITDSAFASCVKDEKYRAWTAKVTDAATSAGVNGTPTVKVNGKEIPQPPTADAVTKAVG